MKPTLDNTKYRVKFEWMNAVLLYLAFDDMWCDRISAIVTPRRKPKSVPMHEHETCVKTSLMEDHFGDCTKSGCSCERCKVEEVLDRIAQMFGIERSDMLEIIE